MLDLSRLESPEFRGDPLALGKPLQLLLDDVREDPGNPRTEFDEHSLQLFADELRAAGGVKVPVSVRPDPDRPGGWVLNFGARRLRASRLAGLATIPAFVDDTVSDWDKVAENQAREPLTPMEVALFIRRMGGEHSNAAIAKRLGLPRTAITFHLALLDLPGALDDCYRRGRCRSPQVLYMLRNLHREQAAAVEAWLAGCDEITRAGVDALRASLGVTAGEGGAEAAGMRGEAAEPEDAHSGMAGALPAEPARDVPAGTAAREGAVETASAGTGTGAADETSGADDRAIAGGTRFGGFRVRFHSREGVLVARPAPSGRVLVRFEDSTETHALPARDVKLLGSR